MAAGRRRRVDHRAAVSPGDLYRFTVFAPTRKKGLQPKSAEEQLADYEKTVLRKDSQRFFRDTEALAETDPDIAEWLKDHEEILE